MKRHIAIFAGIGLAVIGIIGQASGAPGDPNGELLFRQRCAMCHSVVAARQLPLGPNLAGVVGRKAAATGFAYSPALKGSGLTWNAATLDRYLAAPTRVVPGTKMIIAVPSPADRAALIAYLGAAH